MGRTLFDKVWDSHLVQRDEGLPELLYIDLHLVHEVTSPQAFEGLRLAGRAVRRPGPDARDDGSQRRHGRRHADGRALGAAARGAQGQLRGVRRPALRDRQRARGHRPCHRPGARCHAAGHDDRVRRLAHVDARRVRRARVRDRHVRGRARARDADLAAEQAALDADPFRGRVAGARDGEGHRARGDRRARRRRRRRLRHRVRRSGDRAAVDGGPPHDLQHVDRGGRARGNDRAGRDDVRVSRGTPGRAERRRVGAGARALARSAHGRRCRLRQGARDRRLRARLAGHVGHEPGHGRADRRRRARSGGHRRRRLARGGRARPRLHGTRARHADPGDRGRPRVHRLVHELAHRGPARGGRGGARAPCASVGARDGRPRLCAGEGAGGGGRPRSRSSWRPASNGGAPGARCASA